MLIFVGLPLFFLELSFGQYAGEGPITIWKISPLFQGIGYAMFLMSILIGIYYNMILAWALFYLMSSCRSVLPWSSCDNWWNTAATRGLLATDHVILNHGQVTWTTPELAPPLRTTTPHQREDVSALVRFNVHRCPTRRVFSGTGLEPVTKQATIRYLYHSATAVLLWDSNPGPTEQQSASLTTILDGQQLRR
ncbi:sodium- and chloride-dependent glycine transporter 1 [Trichonephila clavipes]|nr:sodium- and chloride-dependent glycine transporter 1 [Trichonephila clavipes]